MANQKYIPNIDLEKFLRVFDEGTVPRISVAIEIESMRLPTERLVSTMCAVNKESDIPAHHTKAKMIHDIADYVYSKAGYDVSVEDNVFNHTLEYRMSAYVFTREQLLNFIRDVEDAVKEQLAQ